jgi:hypothetical protein
VSWRDGPNAAKWIPVISTAEINHGIPEGLSSRQCFEESRFNPLARNPTSGAVGLFQLLPKYFSGAGVNPVKDIGTATAYLASLAKRFGGDYQLGLAAYDWGPGSVDKWQKSGGTFQSMPKETQDYVTQIVADVPVAGVLCKTPSLPVSPQVPQGTGFQVKKSSSVPSSASSSAKSLFSRVTSIFRSRQLQPLALPSADSLPPFVPISSPTSQPKETSVSTPNPILIAAAPTLIQGVQLLQTAINTILTGDPMQIPLRAGPAAAIFVSQLELLLPGLATAETGAVQTDVNAKLGGLITKLQAIQGGAATAVIPKPVA